jgi:hypothetical protein
MDHPTIRVAGDQLEEPPPYAIPFFTAIGFAVAHWARLEQQIDVLLMAVNREHHSTEKYKPTPNTSFRRKCDLFKRWFVKDARFAEYHTNAERLHKSFATANDYRTLLVHSNIQEFREGPPPIMVVQNLKIEGNGEQLRIRSAEWTEDQVIDVGKRFSGLNLGLYTISQKVLTPEFLDTL